MDLTALANRSLTDKGSVTGQGHGYTLLYDLLFAPRRLEPLTLCEIGLCIGGPEVEDGAIERTVSALPSVSMWLEYFPKAHVVGVDISDFSAFESDRFKFVQADAGDAKQLAKVADLDVKFDIVIDDGSHAAFHQQQTFLSLFPLVKPGGLFIIEDMQWQPSTYELKLPHVPRTDILFDRFLRTGHFGDTGALSGAEWLALEPQIRSVFSFDVEWLYAHRRQYNARHGLKPDQVPIWEREDGGRFYDASWVRRIVARLRADLQGPTTAEKRPPTKLLVIQKT